MWRYFPHWDEPPSDRLAGMDAETGRARDGQEGERWSAAAGGGPPGGFDGSYGGGGYGAPPPPGAPPPGGPPPPYGYGGPPPPAAPFGYGAGTSGYGPAPQVHQLANAALACGVASLPMSCCCNFLSFPLAITAIVCGIMGLSRIKAQPQMYEGTNHCIGGIAMGVVGLVLFVVMLAFGIGGQLLKAFGKHY